ncbi:Hypothetical predicted protein, partial [Paramuricea clavata]
TNCAELNRTAPLAVYIYGWRVFIRHLEEYNSYTAHAEPSERKFHCSGADLGVVNGDASA